MKANRFTLISSGGYNPAEVDAHIDKLEQDLRLLQELHDGSHKHAEIPEEFVIQYSKMQEELQNYQVLESKLKEALEAAHRATLELQEIVDLEARKILHNANQNADLIVNQALMQSQNALAYIKKMRTDTKVFQKRLEILMEAQNEFTDEHVWDEILAPIERYKIIEIQSLNDISNDSDENK